MCAKLSSASSPVFGCRACTQ
jgi:hypothetical protein